MSKNVTLKLTPTLAQELREILRSHQENYSYEFAPKRVVNIREIISLIDSELSK